MQAKTFVTGILIGATIGAATALTLAPKSGYQLRSDINNNSTRYKNQLLAVKSEGTNVKESFSALANEAKNNIPSIINELKETIINFKKDIEPETKNLKQEIESLQKSFNEIEKNIPKYAIKDEETAQ